MVIDLPEIELNYSIMNWVEFEQKVMSALLMINQSEKAPMPSQPVRETAAN